MDVKVGRQPAIRLLALVVGWGLLVAFIWPQILVAADLITR
jgi:hypothetical protein